ncbi:MAG: aminodeoxychorismate/anthranilate synthase component II [Alphaproteobacteria bacterium]|nr:aminodeoxychorismate/anthranilate synthase component II [Alphaproteobacteria bacterium]
MKKILLIDNYDSFTYNIFHSLSKFGAKVEVYRNDKISLKEISKNKFDKIVISPGPGHPNSSGICINLVKHFYKTIPILGICLGHQIIGAAFGGVIKKAKIIMHGKLSKIIHNSSFLFKKIPKNFYATRYHSLIINEKTLNQDFEISAKTEDNIIMAINHKIYHLYGIQFHPESIKTNFGNIIFKNFLKIK